MSIFFLENYLIQNKSSTANWSVNSTSQQERGLALDFVGSIQLNAINSIGLFPYSMKEFLRSTNLFSKYEVDK